MPIVNIYKYPENIRSHAEHTHLTIGDMHGNAIKLLFFLVSEGVFIIDPEAYTKLVTLYRKDVAIIQEQDLLEFETILKNIKIQKIDLLRFIGDNFADRGSNDYYTLKIFEKLNQSSINFEVLLSNHDFEFIFNASNNFPDFSPPTIWPAQTVSMLNLGALVSRKLISKDSIIEILLKDYMPHIKLVSLDDHHLFFHAPNGIDLIKALATWYQIDYNDETINDLEETVNKINQKFMQHLLNNDLDEISREILRQFGPHSRLTWNRNLYNIDVPNEYNNYQLNYVHGHNGPGQTLPNLINLDTDLGKQFENIENNIGDYKILVSE